jgi:hypothetical protein
MFLAFRALHLFAKSLARIATALEQLRNLYQLELSTRGIVPLTPGVKDEVEVVYGYQEPRED